MFHPDLVRAISTQRQNDLVDAATRHRARRSAARSARTTRQRGR